MLEIVAVVVQVLTFALFIACPEQQIKDLRTKWRKLASTDTPAKRAFANIELQRDGKNC
jgi:hypothetical protein